MMSQKLKSYKEYLYNTSMFLINLQDAKMRIFFIFKIESQILWGGYIVFILLLFMTCMVSLLLIKKYERIWKIINYFFNLEDRHCDFYKYDFMLK